MISADLGQISAGERPTGRSVQLVAAAGARCEAAGARCELREPLQMRRQAALGQNRPRRAPCARHDACRSSTRACEGKVAQTGPCVTAQVKSSQVKSKDSSDSPLRNCSHPSQLAIRSQMCNQRRSSWLEAITRPSLGHHTCSHPSPSACHACITAARGALTTPCRKSSSHAPHHQRE